MRSNKGESDLATSPARGRPIPRTTRAAPEPPSGQGIEDVEMGDEPPVPQPPEDENDGDYTEVMSKKPSRRRSKSPTPRGTSRSNSRAKMTGPPSI